MRGHRYFGYLFVCLVLLTSLVWQMPAYAWKMEADRVTLPRTTGLTSFKRVNFKQTYDTPPLVFSIASEQGSDPSSIRIQNVTTTSFDIIQVEPSGNDGPHIDMDVHYLAIEPGVHTLPDGTVFEAGSISTTAVQHSTTTRSSAFNALPQSAAAVSFVSGFSAPPAVLTMIQTTNNEISTPPAKPSVPWLTAVAQNISNTGMQLALERSEVNNGNVTKNEQIAYLAVTPSVQGTLRDLLGIPVNFETQQTGLLFDGWNNGCDNLRFQVNYSSAPLVFASKRTRQSGDGGWLRRCRLNSSQIGLTVDEDRDNDSERSHPREAASVLVFADAFKFDSSVVPATPDTNFKIESASVLLPARTSGSTAFTKVTFRQSYASPPNIFVLTSLEAPLPTAVRIRNVTTTDFEMAQVSPPGNGSPPAALTVHYVAVTPGAHMFPDGSLIESGNVDTQRLQYGSNNRRIKGTKSYESIAFSAGFRSSPMLLTQIQTMNNESGSPPGGPSTPWLTTATQNLSSSGAQVALERSEVDDGAVTNDETIAWLAIEASVVSNFLDNANNSIDYETMNTPDNIVGVDNRCVTRNFSGKYVTPPLVIAKKIRHDGGDGGWLRRCSLTNRSVGLVVDEDRDNDRERSHTSEAASVLVFSQAFDADFSSMTACGALPATFPIYGDKELDVESGVTVNGNAVIKGKSGNSIASNGVRSDQALSLPAIEPAVFPTNASNTDATAADSPFVSSTAVFYDKISVAKRQSVTFSGGGPFHINKLEVNEAAIVNFAAGEYYLDEFILKDDNIVINVTSGPVILHIGNKIDLEKADNVRINDGGAIDALRIFLHEGASFSQNKQGRDLRFTGIIYGVASSKVEIGERAKLHAAIITSGKIRLFSDVAFTYTPADETAVSAVTTCMPVATGSFRVTHDRYGINCADETITVTALDASGNVNTAFADSITLATLSADDTRTVPGIWAGTSGGGALSATVNGMATYRFVTADQGVASFTLQYREGDATIDIDAYLTANNAVRDDDSEGTITFSPSGFTVTANPLSNPPPASINDPLATQTAGTAFPFSITAFGQTPTDPTCGVIEAYDGNKPIKFWTNYVTTGSNLQATINGASIATSEAAAVNQTITFIQGQATVMAKYKDVGRLNIAMKDDSVADPNLPNGIRGGTNDFVSRPADLQITEVTRLDKTAPATPATDQNGEIFVKAGEVFRVRVNALDSEGSVTPSYGKEGEGILLRASTLVAPAGGQNGTLNDGSIGNGTDFGHTDVDSTTLPDGQFVGANFFWDEVGIIRLQASVADGDYLATGNLVGTEFANNVGRFTPFELLVSEDSGGPLFAPSCGTFSYMDQPFVYSTAPQLHIVAVNKNGDKTSNYDGVWWKLADFSESYTHGGADALPAGITLDSSLAGHNAIDCSAGTCEGEFTTSFHGPFSYARGTGLATPFNGAVSISVPVVDADGIAYAGSPFGIADITFSGTPAGAQQRFGRMRMSNVFGSELIDLSVPVMAEYYLDANTGFVTNTEDSCSTFSSGNVQFSNRIGNLSTDPAIIGAPMSVTMASGLGSIPLVAPGSGNDGSVDLTLDLGTTGANMPWLQYDWPNDGNQDGLLDDNPTATATFGIFRGRDSMIFFQEL